LKAIPHNYIYSPTPQNLNLHTEDAKPQKAPKNTPESTPKADAKPESTPNPEIKIEEKEKVS
jgi:hypothetical protein